MIKGTTKSGYKFELDERIKTDWRMIEVASLAKSDDQMKQIDGINQLMALMFKDKGAALLAHIQQKNDGFIPAEAVANEISEILTATDDLKKS